MSIETAAAGAYPDADEETLDRVLAQIDEENPYLIVHRGERFAQTALERRRDGSFAGAGRFVVEYRDGSGQHFQTHSTDRDEVRAILRGWAFDRPGWRDGLSWERLKF